MIGEDLRAAVSNKAAIAASAVVCLLGSLGAGYGVGRVEVADYLNTATDAKSCARYLGKTMASTTFSDWAATPEPCQLFILDTEDGSISVEPSEPVTIEPPEKLRHTAVVDSRRAEKRIDKYTKWIVGGSMYVWALEMILMSGDLKVTVPRRKR